MDLRLKFILIKISRILSGSLHLFPIDKRKIIFTSFGGKQISCNPYYIYKSICQIYPDKFKYRWIQYHSSKSEHDGYKTIKYGTWSYLWNMLTAGCVVTNDTLPSYLNFSKKQLVINTWHGGGLFKCTFGQSSKSAEEYVNKINRLHNSDINLYIGSSEAWNIYVANRRFGYTGTILNCGMPRNDIFFKNHTNIITKVKHYFNIPLDHGIILYAPTFRGSPRGAEKGILETHQIDSFLLLQTLKEKFGKEFHFVFRGHHLLADQMQDCLNASNYPDMQELLAAADVLITDYSSSLWDFSLTHKPSFIYAPDFDEYLISPGFESDYREWPFPIAKSNEDLKELIIKFDQDDYIEKCEFYHNTYKSFETGIASDTVAKFIGDHLLISTLP